LDFSRQLLWVYSTKLGQCGKERTIGFRYAYPIGHVRLSVRANAGADAFIHGEVFEHEYYRLPLPFGPATILDLGANIGLTAVYFGRLFPGAQLACVEPVPSNVLLLKRNLELNGVRATVFAAAVHDQDGSVEVELDAKDYGHRVVDGPSNASGSRLNVAAITIPTILQQLGWERIGLLKVDIEGHEKVLFSKHCDWLSRVEAICIECHEGFGGTDLDKLAQKYDFAAPRKLPGIWLLTRE
jgi:FkbM family methyltransferase